MAEASTALPLSDERNWTDNTKYILERLRLPYWLVVVIACLLILAEQVWEYSLGGAPFSALDGGAITRLLVMPIMSVYILIFLPVLRQWAIDALIQLRPTVQISDEDYAEHARGMVTLGWQAELLILLVAVVVVVALWVAMGWELMSATATLPAVWYLAAVVLVAYTLFGWLLLLLGYSTIRHAIALARLAQNPLHINVFDQSNLFPFGRLSLLHTLPTIGVILIPLLILGMPQQAGFVVVIISLVALLTFFLPLWSVHQQIDSAKDQVRSSVYQHFSGVQGALLQGVDTSIEDLSKISDRIDKLGQVRKTIDATPSWPFQSSAAFRRSIAAVSSPVLAFILNEILRNYIAPIIQNLGGS